MKIIGEKKGYIIHKVTENSFSLCRIIKEYENLDDAHNDLADLLTGGTSERKLAREQES